MANRTVDDHVAHPGDDAAEHGGIDDNLHLDVLAGGTVERLAQALDCSGVSGTALRTSATSCSLLGRRQLDEAVDDPGQLAGPAGGRR